MRWRIRAISQITKPKAWGTLHAEEVRFESNTPQIPEGMIVAVNSSTQFDMVMTNEAQHFKDSVSAH
jgi:hypothetical protein